MPDTTDFPAYNQIFLKQRVDYFNTLRVSADVHWRFAQSAAPCGATAEVDVPALVRSRFLYLLFGVSRNLCF